MPLYARQTTIDAEFGNKRGRRGIIACKGCNCNIAADPLETVYIIYVDWRSVNKDMPQGVYCADCLKRSFRKAVVF